MNLNKTLTRRFLNEIYEELIPDYISKVNIVLEHETITLYIDNITIILTTTYPFHPPIVFINTKSHVALPYSKFLIPPTNRINNHINDLGLECLCCSSIITNPREKWQPTYTLNNVISEINSIKELKQKMVYVLAVERFLVYYGNKCGRQLNIDRVILEFLFSYDK